MVPFNDSCPNKNMAACWATMISPRKAQMMIWLEQWPNFLTRDLRAVDIKSSTRSSCSLFCSMVRYSRCYKISRKWLISFHFPFLCCFNLSCMIKQNSKIFLIGIHFYSRLSHLPAGTWNDKTSTICGMSQGSWDPKDHRFLDYRIISRQNIVHGRLYIIYFV